MRWQRRRLAEQVMDAYVDWRNQCGAVRVAYSRWESARASDAVLWHSAYTAALDREELAAKFYGRLLRRAGSRSGTSAAEAATVRARC
jgi:hypothetical protein